MPISHFLINAIVMNKCELRLDFGAIRIIVIMNVYTRYRSGGNEEQDTTAMVTSCS